MAIPLSARERDDARFMPLDGEATSSEAHRVAVRLASAVAQVEGSSRAPGRKLESTIAAVVCDLLQAEALGPRRWSYRSFDANSFSGGRIGYRVFKRAVDGFRNHDMVEFVPGHQQRAQVFGSGPLVRQWARAARLRANDWLLRMLADHGLTTLNWADHFRLVVPDGVRVKNPLVVRRSSVRVRNERFQGFGMPLDLRDSRIQAEVDRMDRLNHWVASVSTAPVPFLGFRRIFNNGDAPEFAFNTGGRIYAVGGGYQTMKKETRPLLTINGAETVEIDIRASHLTILAHRRGIQLDPNADPYEVNGLPRELVKAVVTMTLGHSGFHRAWPPTVLKRLEPVHGRPLRKKFPLSEVLEKVLAAIPALRGWGEDELTALHLQFIESEAILLAVERLAYEHGVISLPLHDSLLSPASAAKVAEATLGEAFREVVGITPILAWRR